jgi:hypothetical protein
MVSFGRYAVVKIGGLKRSELRGIVFLVREGDRGLDAASVFATLALNSMRAVATRFDFWIDLGRNDNYFHGWPSMPDYKKCFVFKWKDKRGNHRLYGFLCNPQPKTRPRFQLCVLVSHAIKNEWKTDPKELDGANALTLNFEVMTAIRAAFQD